MPNVTFHNMLVNNSSVKKDNYQLIEYLLTIDQSRSTSSMSFLRSLITHILLSASAILFSIGLTYTLVYYWLRGDFILASSIVSLALGFVVLAWVARGKLDKAYPDPDLLWKRDNIAAVICGLFFLTSTALFCYVVYLSITAPSPVL